MPDDDPCTTHHYPFEVQSVGRARQDLALSLKGHPQLESLTDDAMLVLSEIMSNGIRHGRATTAAHDIEVSWCLHEDALRISVCDGGTEATLEPSVVGPEALSGRGLSIVDFICEAWTVDHSEGTRVTAELSPHRDSAATPTS